MKVSDLDKAIMYFKKAYIRHIIFRIMSLIGLVSLYILYYEIIDSKSYMLLSLLWLGSIFIYLFLDYEKSVWRDLIYSLNDYEPISIYFTCGINLILISLVLRFSVKVGAEGR